LLTLEKIVEMTKKKEKDTVKDEFENLVSEENIESTEKVQDSDKENNAVDSVKEESLEEQFSALNDKYLRLYSDFDNYRKRTIKEKSDLISNANANLLKDLLTVIDDFERAIVSNNETEDVTGLKEGFNLIYNKFSGILTSKGLKPMNSEGTTFDLDLHEAITNTPVEKEEDKGKIVAVVEKGYYLNDKVLRYAKVVVGQ
jgi:molecular chaperone GrpE